MILTLLTGLIVFVVFLYNTYIHRYRFKALVGFMFFTLFFVLPHIYAILFALELKSKGMLYLGKGESFISTTVGSLFLEFTYPYKFPLILLGVFVFLQILIIIYVSLQSKPSFVFYITNILFIGTILGTILMHYLLGINYTVERAAVHFFILWIVAFYFTIDNGSGKAILAGILPLLFFTIQFFYVFNISYLYHWKYESVSYTYYNYLVDWRNKNNRLPTISSSFLQKTVFAWNEFQSQTKLNSTQDQSYPDTLADFIFCSYELEGRAFTQYDTVIFDKGSQVCLLERKNKLDWKIQSTFVVDEEIKGSEYITIKQIDAIDFLDKPFLFDIRFLAQSDFYPLDWFLVCDIFNVKGEKIYSETVDLQMTLKEMKSPSFIQKRIIIPKVPVEAIKINFLIWNADKKLITISNVTLKTYCY